MPVSEDDGALSELTIINQWLDLEQQQSDLKKQRKQADDALDAKALAQYAKLTEADIKALVVDDKWLDTLERAILDETERSSRDLARRVRELADRYADTLPSLQAEVDTLQATVDKHLEKMGFAWT